MRKPSLTVETLVAALAVLGATASLGCDKRESAAPEPAAGPAPPPPAATAATAPSTVVTPGAQADQPSPVSAAPVQPNDVAPPKPAGGARAVDGGPSTDPRKSGAKDKGSASCGAGACSPDMKKGGGN